MKRKNFIGIILICLVLPMILFGTYQLGYSSGFKKGQSLATLNSNTPIGPSGSWIEGYQAGLKAAQNNSGVVNP